MDHVDNHAKNELVWAGERRGGREKEKTARVADDLQVI